MKKSLVIIIPTAILSVAAISIGVISKIRGKSLFQEIKPLKSEENKSNTNVSFDSLDNEIKIDDDKIDDEVPLI
ncbi:MAG: hypothetical protein E7214_00225 [Clostridium sp.]|nr:hypothetical protein [Clostridium sp.]